MRDDRLLPVDAGLRYLRQTNRPPERCGSWRNTPSGRACSAPTAHRPGVHRHARRYGTVEPSIASQRPQDKIRCTRLSVRSRNPCRSTSRGFELSGGPSAHRDDMPGDNGHQVGVGHGVVVIAAISCTNTSNPAVMIRAGLLARKAVGAGCAARHTQDQVGSRLEGRHGLPQGSRTAAVPGLASTGGLRLHLHRQQRSAARQRGGRGGGAAVGRRRRAEQ